MIRVGLFVTCFVDLFRPSVGFAAVKLLEHAGCTVDVPRLQTCCGQPAYNSGDRRTAIALARQWVDVFERYDYVVVPSGSCAGILVRHAPGLLADDAAYAARSTVLAERTFELLTFLADVRGIKSVPGRLHETVTYHDGCSGLRELGIRAQARALLGAAGGTKLVELPEADACCGFGGLFCVKYGDIATHIADQKLDNVKTTGATTLLAGDLGCLFHLAGRAARRGDRLRLRHVAEVLAGMGDGPAIGEAAE